MVDPTSHNRSIVCNHSTVRHLFRDPLCKEQSLFRRISNVMFHVLTLGIPLAVYKLVVACCGPDTTRIGDQQFQARPSIGSSMSIKSDTSIRLKEDITVVSDLELTAIDRGKQILENFDKATLDQFPYLENEATELYGPVNQEVKNYVKLTKIYRQNLMDLIKTKDPTTVWQDKAVLDCANDLMMLHVTTYNLMFEDLEDFMNVHQDAISSQARALTDSYGYMSDVFFRFMQDYNQIHRNMRFEDNTFKLDMQTNLEKSKVFYDKGTIQNNWRLLHNVFCEKFHRYAPEQDLGVGTAEKFARWSRIDDKVVNYKEVLHL